jgi:hypothetical protein
MRFNKRGIEECHIYRTGENSIFIHDCNITVYQNSIATNYTVNEVIAQSDNFIYAAVNYNYNLEGNELTDIQDGNYNLWVRYDYEITPKVKYLDVIGLPVTGFGKLYFWDSTINTIKYVFGKSVADISETGSEPVYFDIERNRQTSYKLIANISINGADIRITNFYRNATIEPEFRIYFGRGQLD